MLCDSYGVNQKGHFTLGGVDTVTLAEKYQTPLYIVDENLVRLRMRTYKEATKKYFGGQSGIHYASKAFSCKEIYRIAADEGIGVDVVSIGELYTAVSAGFPADMICYHGNNKTDDDIRTALSLNVGEFMVDSFEELAVLDALAGAFGKRQRIMLRLTPNIDPHTQKAISTGELDSKFGTPIETGQAEKLTKFALSLKNVELEGFHSHIGSQTFETQPFIDQADVMFEFAAKMRDSHGFEAKKINLGGGFGVAYTDADPKIDYVKNISEIGTRIDHLCDKYSLKKPSVFMEPGRSIVADAGVTLYTVGSVKEIDGVRTYVSVDGGMTDNPRYALYGAKYTVLVANKADAPREIVCTLAGRCCESGDMIGENMPLQRVERGDKVAVLVTGAYNYSMASNYNRVPRAAVVFVKDGMDRLVVRRESLDDIVKSDI